MDIFGNKFANLHLKCDFPARESFREALLDQLKADVAQRAQAADDAADAPEDQIEMAELSDDDLWLLAAAGDHQDCGQFKFNIT